MVSALAPVGAGFFGLGTERAARRFVILLSSS